MILTDTMKISFPSKEKNVVVAINYRQMCLLLQNISRQKRQVRSSCLIYCSLAIHEDGQTVELKGIGTGSDREQK